jgi:hypothetical protein
VRDFEGVRDELREWVVELEPDGGGPIEDERTGRGPADAVRAGFGAEDGSALVVDCGREIGAGDSCGGVDDSCKVGASLTLAVRCGMGLIGLSVYI